MAYTYNTGHDSPMWRHNICNNTGPNPVVLCNKNKKEHAQISCHHLTLGQIRIPKDTNGVEHLHRRLLTGTKPHLRRNAVCTCLH